MGTGPRLRSSSVSRVCFIKCKKFKGNFTMALCFFGGVSDQCGATAWAPHETGMVSLLSCENGMTEWLKEKYKGSGASGVRGRQNINGRLIPTAEVTSLREQTTKARITEIYYFF